MSIAGPGATNLLTGLWDANVDRAPVLALTGQVETQVLGPGAFQEIDQTGAFGKVAQWSQTVLHNSRHTELMNLACKSAILNRGVSHLIFPDEVPRQELEGILQAGTPDGRIPSRNIAPPEDALNAAIALLRKARRPVIVVGHGARFQMDSVITLAEELKAPVITTFKGKGLISDAHPLAGGVLGRSGTPVISKEQRAGNWEVWQTSLHNPDFFGYAELCGAPGIRVTKASELDAALKKALSHPGPALVEVMTDAELV